MTNIISPELKSKFNIKRIGYTEQASALSYKQFDSWVDRDDADSLKYLKDHRKNIRSSIHNYYPEFKSALVFLFDYTDTKKALSKISSKHNMASYIFGFKGEDYHLYLRKALMEVLNEVKLKYPQLEAKLSLDTQPVLERDLAYRAGLGWFGKNSMLINRHQGSYFLIGSLLLNEKLELNETSPEKDHCGTCNACADACPTQAIDPIARTLNSKDCISTYTIEVFKDSPAPANYDKANYIFGCDICQDVCPWNNKPLVNAKDINLEISPFDKLMLAPRKESISFLESFSKRSFQRFFKNTPLERTGRDGLLKNFKYQKD